MDLGNVPSLSENENILYLFSFVLLFIISFTVTVTGFNALIIQPCLTCVVGYRTGF